VNAICAAGIEPTVNVGSSSSSVVLIFACPVSGFGKRNRRRGGRGAFI
jgi:hypothetical protein